MTPHPSDRHLAAFAAGDLADRQMDTIGQHVHDCALCADRVDRLAPAREPLMARLRLGATLPGQSTPTSASDPQRGHEINPPLAPAEETTLPIEKPATASPHTGQTTHRLPKQFGRYRIERKLGEGGMGAVYLAQDGQLDRQVALKVPVFDEEGGAEIINRFYREAQAMATLQHPNLCPVFDVGEIDGIHYLTMAFIQGRPLSHYLKKRQPHPGRQVAPVVRKLALALHSAHQAGIVHRDLKPANIVIKNDHEPVIVDFGLSVDERKVRLTQPGAVLGTFSYMAPEQLSDQQTSIGPATDIYALGVILYQMVTGKLPFEGPIPVLLAKILTEEPDAPRSVDPDVALALEAICLKAMAKTVADRYGSCRELASDLGNFLKGKRPTAVSELQVGRVELDYKFTVACRVCSTRLDVTADQIGNTIRCPDCHSESPLTEPPLAARRYDQLDQSDDEELRLSPQVEQPRIPRTFLATPLVSVSGSDPAGWGEVSAESMLRKARFELEKDRREQHSKDWVEQLLRKVKGLFIRVFSRLPWMRK